MMRVEVNKEIGSEMKRSEINKAIKGCNGKLVCGKARCNSRELIVDEIMESLKL